MPNFERLGEQTSTAIVVTAIEYVARKKLQTWQIWTSIRKNQRTCRLLGHAGYLLKRDHKYKEIVGGKEHGADMRNQLLGFEWNQILLIPQFPWWAAEEILSDMFCVVFFSFQN